MAQFVAWQDQAIAAGLADPACALATQQRSDRQRWVMVSMRVA